MPMIDLFKIKHTFLTLIGVMLSFASYLHAQGIVAGDTSYNKWKHSIVHVQSIYKNDQSPGVNDTLIGTGFLLTDDHKFYLVTTKHLIKATLMGKNEQAANDAITICGYLDVKKKFDIGDASGKDINKRAVAFTSDEEDIGIISLQKKEYKDMLSYLLAQGATPIPIQLIDVSNNHKTNEWVYKYGYSIHKTRTTLKMESVGMGVCQIDEYNPTAPFFTIKSSVFTPGNNGSPITYNDKLIGILSNATGIMTNNDILQQPTYVIRSAKIIKASYILSCLRKLQQVENDPVFNN